MLTEIASTQQRALEILERLKPLYSDAPCPLNYENPRSAVTRRDYGGAVH
jgi:hypothetical protein